MNVMKIRPWNDNKKGSSFLVPNEDKYDLNSDEDGASSSVTVPSYSDKNVLDDNEEEVSSKDEN